MGGLSWLHYHLDPNSTKKTTSYQYKKSYCRDKIIIRSYYLNNGMSYTGKMASLYWTNLLDHNSINKMPSYHHRNSHYKNKAVSWSSYFYNGNPYTCTWKDNTVREILSVQTLDLYSVSVTGKLYIHYHKKMDHILYSASATAVLCTPLCNIGPNYSGTWLYNISIRNITVKEFNSLP